MKVKVRKILLCVFFALFIVTLFTASFSLGRYSSVQSSESDYDDDFEYTLYDSIVVNTIDEFFAAISNGYNYIIIGDAIKDPLIIAGSMSDIRDDLIIDLNGHEILRNSRDPLLNVTTGFTLTIIDSERTGSMYNPVGSVIQVSGGTLTVQNGIFESGPRSDDSRNGDSAVNYNEYVQTNAVSGELYSTPGGGSISDTEYTDSNGTAAVTLYTNPIIKKGGVNATDSAKNYGTGVTANLPVIMPKFDVGADGDMTNGSMYFDENTNPRYGSLDNNNYIIENDTYLYYTFESDNMQYSTAADKSTANYYYQYYVEGGSGNNIDFTYAQNQKERVEGTDDNRILVTVYVFNDVKYYAAKQSGYTDSSGTPGFAAVKMQSGNLYVRGGTYYSYFGEENTFGVQSTGGLMSVNPTGSNAINFYAYQNGVCVDCRTTSTTVNEMLNISSGNFYSELGDTVRVTNGSLTIGTADFTKDVSANMPEIPTMAELEQLTDKERTEKLTELYSYNKSVVNISGGTLNINTRATFNVYGSGVTGIRASSQAASSKATVNTNNATFNFYGAGNSKLDASFTRGVYTDGGSVTFDGTTNINLAQISVDGQSLTSRYNVGVLAGNDGTVIFNGSSSITVGGNTNPSGGNYGIYSTGGGITCGQDSNSSTTIKIAENSASTGNYGIYSGGGSITTYGTTEITLGNTANLSTSNYGIYSSGGTVTLGAESSQSDQATITVNGNSSSSSNFGIQTIGGHIYTYGTTSVTVYGTDSTGVYATVSGSSTAASSINISGQQFTCNVYMHERGSADTYVQNLSSTAISTAGGNIEFNVGSAEINSDGLGITAFNMRVDDDGNLTGSAIPNSGNVEFKQSSLSNVTNEIDLNTLRGTAMYIQGGSVTINSGVTFDVESNTSWELGWQQTNDTPHSHDGILVNGGSLISNGTFNVTHTGVKNDSFFNGSTSVAANDLKDWEPKSFAIRVQGDDKTEVQLNSGTIKNTVGGGLYVSGGAVTLGTQGVTGKTLSIKTEGEERNSTNDYYVNYKDTWYNYDNLTGGDAVIVSGGKLDIYYGIYTAAFGNGIAVKDGTANVHGGLFRGNDPYKHSDRSAPAGAAASYAFKLYGGTANIYGGTFGYEGDLIDNSNWQSPKYDKGGGAFVMGTDSDTAEANIYGGTINIAGTTGLGVWSNVDVILGDKDTKTGPTVNAESTGITAESYSNGSSSITIYGGTYQSYNTDGGKNGIWYGEGKTTLKIHGGTFTGSGSSGSGLRMDAATQSSHTIVISGGNFYGSQAGLWYGKSASVNDGLLIMGGTFEGNNYGVYLAQNPLSRPLLWGGSETNNVAIVAGTFTGGRNAIGDASNNQVKVGDVLIMHESYTVDGTTYNHYGYADGVHESASYYNDTPVNNIGTSVILEMRSK